MSASRTANPTVIKVDGLSKRYRLGVWGGKTLREDLSRWWARVRGREDPIAKLSDVHTNVEGEYIWALRNVSFEVKQGEVLGIVGKNGAGKSTLLKLLTRITAPTSGRIRMKGRVASMLEVGTGFHKELTGRENVYLNGAILGMTRAEVDRKFDEIVAFSGVEQYIDTPVKRYSSGMNVRLAFAVAAHLDPEILIIDEVLAVGDAAFQRRCIGKMGEVAGEGRTVLFVSHQLHMITRLCTRALWVEDGCIRQSGPADEIVQNYVVSGVEQDESEEFSPVRNEVYGVAMTGCEPALAERRGSDTVDLTVRISVESDRPRRSVGIGMRLSTDSGDQVSKLGYRITQHVFDLDSGLNEFLLECEGINEVLTKGRYVMDIWLHLAAGERLLEIDGAAVLEIPGKDRFGSGRPVELSKHGPVLLPIRIQRLKHARTVGSK